MARPLETVRAFRRRRTIATPAEIEKRAHPTPRARTPRRHRCASGLRSSRFRSRGSFSTGEPEEALCFSPRSSRARMRSRAARSLRSVTRRSNSSSRTGTSLKEHEPCRSRNCVEGAEIAHRWTLRRRNRHRCAARISIAKEIGGAALVSKRHTGVPPSSFPGTFFPPVKPAETPGSASATRRRGWPRPRRRRTFAQASRGSRRACAAWRAQGRRRRRVLSRRESEMGSV
jgi:hypothetical protein